MSLPLTFEEACEFFTQKDINLQKLRNKSTVSVRVQNQLINSAKYVRFCEILSIESKLDIHSHDIYDSWFWENSRPITILPANPFDFRCSLKSITLNDCFDTNPFDAVDSKRIHDRFAAIKQFAYELRESKITSCNFIEPSAVIIDDNIFMVSRQVAFCPHKGFCDYSNLRVSEIFYYSDRSTRKKGVKYDGWVSLEDFNKLLAFE